MEMLGHFGIARPAMLEEISALRNLLEHQHKAPPGTARCQELVEFVWYFLRSTDALSTSVVSNFVLNQDGRSGDGAFWLAVTYGPSVDWVCSVYGWIPEALVSKTAEGDIVLSLKTAESYEQFSERSAKVADMMPPRPARLATDIYLNGEVVGGSEAFSKLAEIYFSVL